MRRSLPWLAFVVAFAALHPVFAAEDDAESPAKPDPQAKKAQEKLIKSRKPFLAKLTKIDASKHCLTVEVTYKSLKQDPQSVQHLANLQRQLVQAQRNGNPVDRLAQTSRIQLEFEKAKLNLYKDQTQKFELDAPESMKVRTVLLPLETDEKGKPRRLTEKEKRELKGPDPTLPGYTADFDSLKVDQVVEVYLAKQPPKSKAKEKDQDTDSAEPSRPKIAMIVIRAEPQK
jgi:hypothetical protein